MDTAVSWRREREVTGKSPIAMAVERLMSAGDQEVDEEDPMARRRARMSS